MTGCDWQGSLYVPHRRIFGGKGNNRLARNCRKKKKKRNKKTKQNKQVWWRAVTITDYSKINQVDCHCCCSCVLNGQRRPCWAEYCYDILIRTGTEFSFILIWVPSFPCMGVCKLHLIIESNELKICYNDLLWFLCWMVYQTLWVI